MAGEKGVYKIGVYQLKDEQKGICSGYLRGLFLARTYP
jgi:hypothetical protein